MRSPFPVDSREKAVEGPCRAVTIPRSISGSTWRCVARRASLRDLRCLASYSEAPPERSSRNTEDREECRRDLSRLRITEPYPAVAAQREKMCRTSGVNLVCPRDR